MHPTNQHPTKSILFSQIKRMTSDAENALLLHILSYHHIEPMFHPPNIARTTIPPVKDLWPWSQQVAIRRSTIQQNDIQQTRFPTRQWQSTYWYQQVNIRQTKSTTNLSSIRSVANTQNVTAKVMIVCHLNCQLFCLAIKHIQYHISCHCKDYSTYGGPSSREKSAIIMSWCAVHQQVSESVIVWNFQLGWQRLFWSPAGIGFSHPLRVSLRSPKTLILTSCLVVRQRLGHHTFYGPSRLDKNRCCGTAHRPDDCLRHCTITQNKANVAALHVIWSFNWSTEPAHSSSAQPTKRTRSKGRSASFASWKNGNPLPTNDVYWSWSSQEGPCQHSTVWPSGRSHEIPDDCSARDWDSFLK